ncbi:ThiF family adenylyltransferase [Pectobacterium brasiliense]|uniref:ThiF family adenylyltransferase n=1 Tax=Pectobacterium brasiliense TaxID=180957 RepID=UPI003015CF70
MPDCLKKKIDQLSTILAPYGARKLSTRELFQLKNEYIFAWEIPTDLKFNNESIILQLRYKTLSQFDIPDVFISSPEINVCQLPHLEKNGKLCIWPDSYIIDSNDLSYVVDLLNDAVLMLKKGINGDLNEDFIDEFQNYWVYHCNKTDRIISVCDLTNKNTRLVFGYRTRKFGVVYADTDKELINWLENQTVLLSDGDGSSSKDKRIRQQQLSRIISIPLIFFNDAWYPNQYPKTARDLFDLIKNNHENPESTIELILRSFANILNITPIILISFPTPSGMNIIGIQIPKGVRDLAIDRFDVRGITSGRFRRTALLDGYRKYIDGKILENRICENKIQNLIVDRSDDSWITGREHNPTYKKISEHKIAIIGCGSVGSSVSRLLLQSGIRKMLLWDDDLIKSENPSRHLLGLDSIYKNKALALASKLSLEFPNSCIEAFNEDWTENSMNSQKIEDADIVVSCTAHWNTEQQLLKKQSEDVLGVIVFAFVEAHAMAGHVIVNQFRSDAFNNWHITEGKNIGALKYPATYWRENTRKRIAACAGEFQPYGAIPLANLHALTARTIIDLILNRFSDNSIAYSYLGREVELLELDGKWNNKWIEKFGNPRDGDCVIPLIFEKNNWKKSDA